MKKKILVILSQEIFLRNYITSNAFGELRKSFDLSFCIPSKLANNKLLDQKVDYLKFDYEEERGASLTHILDVLMWKFRSKSTTFKFRIQKKQGFNLKFRDNLNLLERTVRIPWRLARFCFLRIKNILLIDSPLFTLYYYYLKKKLGSNKSLEATILSIDPAMVLFPSSAYDPVGIDVISICKENNIISFFLIDNWDNLSSKSIFIEKPDYISVWGQQSKEHAINIQEIQSEHIKFLGTPRFNKYFRDRNLDLESPYNFKYILFVGTALEFDEITCIQHIDKILGLNLSFSDIKLIYRPHPWRHGLSVFDESKLKNTIIDYQLRDEYLNQNNSLEIQPDLDYYSALIKNSLFVIGGLTSMLIESNIFYKPFVGLIHNDGKNHLTSMHNVYKKYMHFQGIKDLPLIKLCSKLEALEDLMHECLILDIPDKEFIDQSRDYFYNNNGKDYSVNLVAKCNEVFREYNRILEK